ncbi:MAG: 3-phosphoserine/phosphohydroxythreonine transaminase [Defluviitaleaceae bacterium]|nr:3-phosphoserine/phosphohydroxythreonine transaminase [Defluviitaleaceae bacterium]
MRVYNFSPGPAALPVEVLEQAGKEMVEYNNCGMSVMEMSHRSKMYMEIHETAEALLRELMGIPANYKVLFLQGGASQQFAMIPMNLNKNGKADYVLTGEWANKANKEASKILKTHVAATSEDRKFGYIPETFNFTPDADYVHITSNNTICGTRFLGAPDTGNVPLVADMSSGILSEVMDVSKYGLIYAGAQKNIGPAGVAIVIIREDLLENENAAKLPTVFQYKTHADSQSLFNTPPTYSIYTAKLCLEWLKGKGGVEGIQKVNEAKAKLFYDFLDNSALFKGLAEKKYRSLMNIPFTSGDDAKDKDFVKQAAEVGLVNLSGHRLVGGLRASMYNAMPTAGVEKLVDFMKDFEKKA